MKFITVNQIAKQTELSTGRVYEMIRLGLLPAVRFGRQIRVEEQAFKDWVSRGGQAYDEPHQTQAS
jgi:excisionase family DNA binding protein